MRQDKGLLILLTHCFHWSRAFIVQELSLVRALIHHIIEGVDRGGRGYGGGGCGIGGGGGGKRG